MKRSVWSLRIGAAVLAATMLLGVGFEVVFERVFAAMRAAEGSAEQESLRELLSSYATVQSAGYLLLSAGLCVCLALFASSLGRARSGALGWGAFGLQTIGVAAALGLTVWRRVGAFQTVLDESAFRLLQLLWLGRALIGIAALALLLTTVSRAVRTQAAIGWTLLTLYACVAVASLGHSAYETLRETPSGPSDALEWLRRVLNYGQDVVVVAAMLWGAHRLDRDPEPVAGDAAPGLTARGSPLDGSPLRLLASTLLARVLVGALGQGLLIAAMASRSFEMAQALLVLLGITTLVLSLSLASGLWRYLAMPEPARAGGALGASLTLLLLGAAVDLYALVSGVQLFSIVAEAQRATSFWGMPSLSRMQELQQGLEWGGRIALVFGLGASLALLLSLRTTATWLRDGAQRVRANVLLGLTLGAGTCAMALMLLLGMRMKHDAQLMVLLGISPVLLGLGIAALVVWMRLLRGLAAALERGREDDEPSSDPGPSAAPSDELSPPEARS